jgi:mannose-6-phosphate isomerase
MTPLAESWELSAHKDGESKVVGGKYDGLTLSEYIEAIGRGALGKKSEKYDYFPLLIKFIDAKGDLSVQVHPNDEYALVHEGEYGKTEMWYVLDCDEGATLYYGFLKDTTKKEYQCAIKEGRLTEILNKVTVKKGDVFFIPAGTVHAIGAGIVICEIQQNSNTTYRVYDYMRKDANGNMRPLHIEKALEVSNLKKSPTLPEIGDGDDCLLAECEYFKVRRVKVQGFGEVEASGESFLSLTVTDGCGTLIFDDERLDFCKGDSIFVPAQDKKLGVEGACELILSTVE